MGPSSFCSPRLGSTANCLLGPDRSPPRWPLGWTLALARRCCSSPRTLARRCRSSRRTLACCCRPSSSQVHRRHSWCRSWSSIGRTRHLSDLTELGSSTWNFVNPAIVSCPNRRIQNWEYSKKTRKWINLKLFEAKAFPFIQIEEMQDSRTKTVD